MMIIKMTQDTEQTDPFKKWKTPTNDMVEELQRLYLIKRDAEKAYTKSINKVAEQCNLSPSILTTYMAWYSKYEPTPNDHNPAYDEDTMQLYFLVHTVNWPYSSWAIGVNTVMEGQIREDWNKRIKNKESE